MSDKRNIWIDIAKTVAIIGVVLQHLWGWAYDNEFVYNVILYAVPLFVLIGGYNLMDSYLRKGKVPIFKRILKMVLTYLIATLVYCIYGGQITDPGQIVERFMHFDACAPMYYVAVYLWLILVTPILVHVFDCEDQVKKALRAGAGLVIVTMVSYITTKLPDVLPVILGGGKILAGPWLLFHYSGMCIKAYEDKIRKILSGYIPFAVNTVILILWQYLFIYRGINRGIPAVFGYSDILITWAGAAEVLLVFLWFIQAGWIIGDKRGLRAIAFFGKHSLYIFMYHILFLEIYVTYLLTRMLNISHGLNRISLLIFVFLCPVAVEYLFTGVCKGAGYIYGYLGHKASDTDSAGMTDKEN